MKKRDILIVIVCFGITALFFEPSTLAIYRGIADANSDLISAEWYVTLEQDGINDNLIVVPEVANANYTLNVKSLSQVNVKYDIVISNLPSGIDVSLNGVDYPPVVNGTATFINAGTILSNATEKTNSHTLTFRGANGATIVDGQVVTVNVKAEQIMN